MNTDAIKSDEPAVAFCGISHPTEQIPISWEKIPFDYFKNAWEKIPKSAKKSGSWEIRFWIIPEKSYA